MKHLTFLFSLLISAQGLADELYLDFPSEIQPAARYVIYSHGLILEGNTPRPEHPDYGIYEFDLVKQAIVKDGGFNLIAHHRPANTDIDVYVKTLSDWVGKLIDAGVKPSRITLLGFSRGGHLTALASHKLNTEGINTALLASCIDGDIPYQPHPLMSGHLLSIFETSDVMGTCKKLAQRSTGLKSFEEISISTGMTHGAFFRPLPEWVEPLKDWIRRTNR